MKKGKLGKNLCVSAAGVNCIDLSQMFDLLADEMDAILYLRQIADMGYTFFDADVLSGPPEYIQLNEAMLGEAISPYGNHVVIATKFGIRRDPSSSGLLPDAKPETIRKSAERSLRRLLSDHIDLYIQQKADPNVPPEEVAGVMTELIQAGKIRYWGIADPEEWYLRRAHAVCPVTAVEIHCSPLDFHNNSLLHALDELGIGVLPVLPKTLNGSASEEMKTAQMLLEELAAANRVSPMHIVAAWMAGKREGIVPLLPLSGPTQLIQWENFSSMELNASDMAALDTFFLTADNKFRPSVLS